ncbi:Nickel and cobalt resistance protein CnrB [compost metagenome]
MRTITNYLSTLILVISMLCGCSQPAKEESQANLQQDENLVSLTAVQAKNIDLQVSTISSQTISTHLKLSGQVDVPPQNLISISVPLGGYLKSTSLLPGANVKKGQVLAYLEDPQYIQLQQDYLSAKNKLSYAAKEFERQKELNQHQASSDKIFQQAETDYHNLLIENNALAEKIRLIGLNPQQINAGNMTRRIAIYSPINGYVNKVNVNIGKYVVPTDVLFELVDPSNLHLSLTVFEKDLGKLAINQSLIAYSNAQPGEKYQAKVILINPNLNENRSTEIHCHFEKYDKKLVPGMYMNAEIQLSNQNVQALPADAVVNFENKDYVFVQVNENTFQMTPVEIGATENAYTEIRSELTGKKIVVKGAYALLMKLKNTIDEE